MFLFRDINYAFPECYLDREDGTMAEFVSLTPEESAAMPWAQVTTRGDFIDHRLFIFFPRTNLSARLTDMHTAWVYPSDPPREIAVCMALHPRLGSEPPLRGCACWRISPSVRSSCRACRSRLILNNHTKLELAVCTRKLVAQMRTRGGDTRVPGLPQTMSVILHYDAPT